MTRPVALVTGASAGIGDQFARVLAERDHDLVLVARDRARLEALAKELEAGGAAAEVLAADLTDAAGLAAVEARAATVDVLVNNAGFGTTGRFDELDREREDRQVRLDVLAVVRLTHAAVAPMIERGAGGILNVSSVSAFQPGPYYATYAASKAFVLSFTEAVHEELRGTGVAVTCVVPGFTRTEFQERNGFEGRQVPGFMWLDAEGVARAALDGLARNRAVVVPGALYKVGAGVLEVVPHAISRRASGIVSKGIVDT